MVHSRPRLASVLLTIAGGILAVLPGQTRELSYAERLAAQRAIDRFHYDHQDGARKPFDEAVPPSVTERKVTTYLRQSAALELSRDTRVTTEALDREVERIVSGTRFPERLRELFAALGNDPVLIAECIARPILVRRSMPSPETLEIDPGPGESDEAFLGECPEDAWSPLSPSGAPTARYRHTAVWTGSEWLLWGGRGATQAPFGTGAAYDPVLDSWRALTETGAPSPRLGHTAVWTGSRMIVWGGTDSTSLLNTGAAYDPIADAWTPTTLTGAPTVRDEHVAVWTGDRMVVWGGHSPGACAQALGDGGRYDPVADAWVPVTASGAPLGRFSATAVWTGSEMIVWGGQVYYGSPGSCYLFEPQSGGRYDPAGDAWTPTSVEGAPYGTDSNEALWTGSEMIAWPRGFGSRYSPAHDTWTAINPNGAPVGPTSVVWTGTRLIAFGARTFPAVQVIGGDFDPIADTWVPLNVVGSPSARFDPTMAWTGSALLVWGGFELGSVQPLGDGGRWAPGDPDSDGDGACDSQDPCPGDPLDDADADAACANNDNCPDLYNPSQMDSDGDDQGEVCDACPLDELNDNDGDLVCGDVDNCLGPFNHAQLDTDGDGYGDVCDRCPYHVSSGDFSGPDSDSDGAGDDCDCRPDDASDRRPGVWTAHVGKSGATSILSCTIGGMGRNHANAFGWLRGNLANLGPRQFGSCLFQGTDCYYEDNDVPPRGEGYFYLLQAQNFECGLGSLGYGSDEKERINDDPGACTGFQGSALVTMTDPAAHEAAIGVSQAAPGD